MTTVRLGSRRSALASAQARWVGERLQAAGRQVEFVWMTTTGDRSAAPLAGPGGIGGTGVFVSALREALLAGRIDLAVHSLKDLPVQGSGPDTLHTQAEPGPTETPRMPSAGLVVAAVPPRQDPRDALVARDGLTLGELPAGARVGTGSPRRAAQLSALGLGLQVEPLRGNVDTRLGRVRDGALDAVVLARAGLARLGLLEAVTETLDPIQMVPAAGQGALALECRAGDAPVFGALADAELDDPDTRVCVVAERAVLGGLGAGCAAPVGVLAEVVEGDTGLELSLRAAVLVADGSDELRRSVVGPVADPVGLAQRLVRLLLDDGARQLLAPASALATPSVISPASAHSQEARL